MKNLQPSFNNVKEYAKFAFDKALTDDLTLLEKAKEFEEHLKITNPALSEMFSNDFAYEVNTNQAKHFLKTGTLLSINNSIPTIASVWVLAWSNAATKGVQKLKIDKSFDFRAYPFEDTKYAVDKLSMIFEHVFLKNEKDAEKCYTMKDDVVVSYNFYRPTDHAVKNSFIDTVYRLASLQTFKKSLKNQENVWDDIIKCYYGKYKKENEDFFSSSVYNLKDKTEKENKLILMKKVKQESLSLRDEDFYYWKYFVSIENDSSFLNALEKNIDFGKESIAKTSYIKNNHDIMQKEFTIDLNKKLIKKTLKI